MENLQIEVRVKMMLPFLNQMSNLFDSLKINWGTESQVVAGVHLACKANSVKSYCYFK